ncbi:MAG: S46 family peptidase [Bacteroidales bacterium]|nr:S46 family peptidase [Bacteroidales bacterium]
MKTKFIPALLVILLGINCLARSDEGLWLPILVKSQNYSEMQKMGLHLSPEEIYDINHSSIKDAVVQFSDFSSGAIISPNGLLITSHNSGIDYVHAHSTLKNDYLKNGYWAMNMGEELPNPGLSVTFLIRMENVTEKVVSKLRKNMSEEARISKISDICEDIVSKAENKTHYSAEVKSFCHDNEFYLFVYEIFNDVRLVGIPPSSIGSFGGDTDNWMWPRHTGDFSLFRVYTSPDGKPAEYSEYNIPLKSKSHLPISVDGFNEFDFAMTLGYPLNTDRYISSDGVEILVEETNPALKRIKDKKLKVMINKMDESEEIKHKYATKFAQTSNYSKYYLGKSKQLKRCKVCEKKKKLENEFDKWANSNHKRKEKYGNVISKIYEANKKLGEYNLYNQYCEEVVNNGADLLILIKKFYPVYLELQSLDKKKAKSYKIPDELREAVRNYIVNVDQETDKKIFKEIVEFFYNEIKNASIDQLPEVFSVLQTEYNNDFDWFTNAVYNKSIFANYDELWVFVNNPELIIIENDYAFKLYLCCMEKRKEINDILKESNLALNKYSRLFKEGLEEMNPKSKLYCDANSSMRLSYGQVKGSMPSDGLISKHYTTLHGVMEKEDSDDSEFFVPEKLKHLYNIKDYGNYSDGGIMNVCFTTDNDATAGSAGSPVINGDGHIIGLVFDLNWEGMSGDISFEPELQRTINTDIRYVLFIVDKFAGAKYLVDEMTIINSDLTKK